MKILTRSGKEKKFSLGDVLLQESEAAPTWQLHRSKNLPGNARNDIPWWNGPSGRIQLSLNPAISDHLCSIKKES
jgi:hypothetical protein